MRKRTFPEKLGDAALFYGWLLTRTWRALYGRYRIWRKK